MRRHGRPPRAAGPPRPEAASRGRAPAAAAATATHLLGEVVLQPRQEKQHHDEPADNRHCRGDENRRQPRRSRPPRLASVPPQPARRRRRPEPLPSAGPQGPPAAGPRPPSPRPLTQRAPARLDPKALQGLVLGKASNRFSRHSESMAPRGPEPNPPSGAGPAPPRHRPAGQRGPKPAEGAGGEGLGLGLPGSEGAGRSSLPPRPLLTLPASGPRGGALEITRLAGKGLRPRRSCWQRAVFTHFDLLPIPSRPVPSPASSFDRAGVCYPRPSQNNRAVPQAGCRSNKAESKSPRESASAYCAEARKEKGRKRRKRGGKKRRALAPPPIPGLHPSPLPLGTTSACVSLSRHREGRATNSGG